MVGAALSLLCGSSVWARYSELWWTFCAQEMTSKRAKASRLRIVEETEVPSGNFEQLNEWQQPPRSELMGKYEKNKSLHI